MHSNTNHKEYVNKTPVLTSRMLNDRLGAQIYFKGENFQRVGAFKFRGAMNAVSKLSDEKRSKGVIAFSSGNHAQAIALSAKLLNVPATIVMPEDAPRPKLENTKRLGGEVITYDRYTGDREAIGEVQRPEFGQFSLLGQLRRFRAGYSGGGGGSGTSNPCSFANSAAAAASFGLQWL